jgi:hypothetical protein
MAASCAPSGSIKYGVISSLAEELLTSPEELCSIKLVDW